MNIQSRPTDQLGKIQAQFPIGLSNYHSLQVTLNTPNFDRPNTDLSRGDFGSITRTIANPRIAQFALKIIF